MGRKPNGLPMTQTEMIEAGRQKRSTSRIYRAEADEIKDEAISHSINHALQEIRRADTRKKVSLDDTATVKAFAEAYLESCAVASVFPSMASFAMSIGHTRENLYRYMERHPDSETGKFLIQLHDQFSTVLAENSLRNNSNAIVSIFLLKSLCGYKDTQTFELVQNTSSDTPSVDEIALRANLLADD